MTRGSDLDAELVARTALLEQQRESARDIAARLASEVLHLEEQRPTWQRAADEIRAQARMRGDLDDWTVESLAKQFERLDRKWSCPATPAPVIPEQVRR